MPMPIVIATGDAPFRYSGSEYAIRRAGIDENGEAYATVVPFNDELAEELKRRISAEKGLRVYLGPGYRCFPEDYPADLSS